MEEGPVGFRFHPNDKEIIDHYLKCKMEGMDILVDEIIREIDPCRLEPWDLPDHAVLWSGDQVWYFYCRLDYKDVIKSKRANRSTKAGYWKATGRVRFIKDNGRRIGTKRTLVFYQKVHGLKPIKTNWVTHEYQAQTILPHQIEYVLWKLKNKADYPADDDSPTNEEGINIAKPSTSDHVDFQPQSSMHNPQGNSMEDPADKNPAFGSSDDELAAEQLADSFLICPYEYSGSDQRIHKHEHRAVCRDLVAEEKVYEEKKVYEEVQFQGGKSLRADFGKGAFKLRSNQSASTDKKGRLIHLETPASSYGPSPPSVYILNVLIGLVLFIIILMEMLIFH